MKGGVCLCCPGLGLAEWAEHWLGVTAKLSSKALVCLL